MLRRCFVLFSLSLLLFVVGGCKKPSSDEAKGATPPIVKDSSVDLLFTWIDENGGAHVEQKVTEVPIARRTAVRVADAAHDPAPGEVWIVDLRVAAADGSYPVHSMKRAEWEALVVGRREGGALVARPPSPAPPEARPAVIIYGASWCGPCHQAAEYLERHGVTYVMKDIEREPGAAREMHAKLARSGMREGSIPVLDVRGRILVGFDARRLDQALGEPL